MRWEEVQIEFLSNQNYCNNVEMMIYTHLNHDIPIIILHKKNSAVNLIIPFYQIQKLCIKKTLFYWKLQLWVSAYGSESVEFTIIDRKNTKTPEFIYRIYKFLIYYNKKNCLHYINEVDYSKYYNFEPKYDPNSYTLYHSFPIQKQAFEYLYSLPQQVQEYCKLLCFESPTTGKRQFCITTVQSFPSRYLSLLQEDRHYYEIIVEGTPSHIYMDIEYLYSMNPSHPDPLPVILYTFSQYLCLYTSIYISPSFFLLLSSEHKHKYSKHIVFHLPNNSLFSNNQSMGIFMKNYISIYQSLYSMDSRGKILYKSLFVKDKHGNLTSVIDPAVYTKNRAMRLLYSCKYIKPSDSSQSNTVTHAPLIPVGNVQNSPPYYLLQQSYITESNVPNASYYIDISMELSSLFSSSSSSSSNPKSLNINNQFKTKNKSLLHEGQCPYISLYSYIYSILQSRDHGGWVRKWRVFCTDNRGNQGESGSEEMKKLLHSINTNNDQLIYTFIMEIGQDRWCGNINRQHHSNHIYFYMEITVPPKSSSIPPKGYWTQKCHDIKCKDYHSPYISIPYSIVIDIINEIQRKEI
ncbi:hypothetical protein WA158_000701 [Blastocystis sp. Blastoise]